jgi:hypothetical protein
MPGRRGVAKPLRKSATELPSRQPFFPERIDEGTWPARDVASLLRTAYRATQADEDASALEARYTRLAPSTIILLVNARLKSTGS